MEERKMVSCFKGLAPVSFPGDWLENFDMERGFGYREATSSDQTGEAFIRFPINGRAFGVLIEFEDHGPLPYVRELSREEILSISWGPFEAPWEPYNVAKIFGHGKVIPLD